VFDTILASGMEATADVQMRLPAAGVAGTTIPSQQIRVSESLCADPLLNRVKWSAGSRAFERLPHDSAPAPAAPEVPPSVVVALRGCVMKACRAFSQVASGVWTLVTCDAAFYMCIASFCTRKQIHRRAPAGGRLVLAVVAVAVLLQLLSTVGAAKSRSFRDATANMWAEGKPTSPLAVPAMAAGQDGSLYVLEDTKNADNVLESKLLKLDLDTKKWQTIEPRGSLRPSVDMCCMVAVGNHLYVFGGWSTRSNTLFRFSMTEQKWELICAPQVSGSPPSARTSHGMLAVGSDLYVFGGHTEGGINTTGTYADSFSNELFRFSTLTLRWDQLYAQQAPSAREDHGMVAVVTDFSFYVFGGHTAKGKSNEFFRFSTKQQKWEQLNVSGSPPSARSHVSMVNTVGSDLYLFGGFYCNPLCSGEEGLCDDGHRLGACQIERLGDAPRAAAVLVATCCARARCLTRVW
jgi:hypothetical protein